MPPRKSEVRRNGDVQFTVFGWWVRLIWGITFKRDRLRWSKFYGYRLLAVVPWGDPLSPKCARLVGIQWRRYAA
jgi:hypothetical protein